MQVTWSKFDGDTQDAINIPHGNARYASYTSGSRNAYDAKQGYIYEKDFARERISTRGQLFEETAKSTEIT